MALTYRPAEACPNIRNKYVSLTRSVGRRKTPANPLLGKSVNVFFDFFVYAWKEILIFSAGTVY